MFMLLEVQYNEARYGVVGRREMVESLEAVFIAVVTVAVPAVMLGLILLIGYAVYREVRGE